MAKVIADELGGDFDVVLVRKLRAPYQPELAIVQLTKAAGPILRIMPPLPAPARNISRPKSRRRWRPSVNVAINTRLFAADRPGRAHRYRYRRWAGHRCNHDLRAARLRARKPLKLICAVPVDRQIRLKGWPPWLTRCVPRSSEYFQAVGQFYRNFSQVEDEEVIEILQDGSKTRNGIKKYVRVVRFFYSREI